MSEFYYFDIGSRGNVAARWRKLAKEVHVVGFEPDRLECNRLNKEARNTPFLSEKHYSVAVHGQLGLTRFYIARSPALSGFYKPIKKTFEQFKGDAERADVLKTVKLQAVSLSVFCERENVRPDFIKIDTQGAEYAILESFRFDGLYEVLAVEVELQVLPLYAGNAGVLPRYTKVQQLLESSGFDLWWIRPQYWKYKGTGRKRIAWFDALYMNRGKLNDPKMEIVYRAYEMELGT
jgi:FkbM family methyltransferase